MAENHQAARFHPPVRYTLRFPDRRTHYLSVEACLPVEGQGTAEIFMPVWTPGSYLVREYARNIEAVSVTDASGGALSFSKSSKNRWRVQAADPGEIRFAYRVYCHEM
jgi:predicted metalloprotease with PDZ domain